MRLRIRTVKPDFFQHEGLYDAEQQTGLPLRLAFEGLWCAADREGRFQWRPRTLKANILPHDDLDFSRVLDALEAGGFVLRYAVDGMEYGVIPSFKSHQSLNQREAPSSLPPPPTDLHVHAHAYPTKGAVPENVRQKVLERDHHRCLKCGTVDDLTLDHVIPRGMGGSHEEQNLRTLCRACNSARPTHGPELAADIAEWYARADICTHVQARVEGNGNGNGREGTTTALVGLKPNSTQVARTYEAIQTHLAETLDAVKAGQRNSLVADEMRGIQSELVFAYWQAKCGHEKALLDDKRLARLKRCLRENRGNVHELLYAVDGWAKDPTFQRLKEQDGKSLDGIDNIFKDRERIERLAGHCKGWREQTPHPMATKYLEAASADPH